MLMDWLFVNGLKLWDEERGVHGFVYDVWVQWRMKVWGPRKWTITTAKGNISPSFLLQLEWVVYHTSSEKGRKNLYTGLLSNMCCICIHSCNKRPVPDNQKFIALLLPGYDESSSPHSTLIITFIFISKKETKQDLTPTHKSLHRN
jgi:hypothetical protein